MSNTVEKIGVVGAGLIGASWAAFYASRGFAVALHDVDAATLQQGHQAALRHLAALQTHGLADARDQDRAAERITVAESLADAVRDARLVQESVPERNDVKQDVFRQIDQAADARTIVASSSSGLLISELQAVMEHPERSLIAHPFNPPHLIPLVELVPGRRTDPRTVDEMAAFFESLGKVPIVLRKEVPGHVANRLQAAIWREAIQLVLDGVVSVADVDKAVSAGPGIRWALMGPHLIFHLAGGAGGIEYLIDHIGSGWGAIWKDMAAWDALPEGTRAALAEGIRAEIGSRSSTELMAWRDAKLVELLKVVQRD